MPDGMPSVALPAGIEKLRPYKTETLEAAGLDPARYPTCSKHVKGANVGCWNWHACKARLRPENKEKPNPRRYGITILKRQPSGKVAAVNQEVDCVSIPQLTAQATMNGGGYRIVAVEGGKLRIRYSETLPPQTIGALPLVKKGIKEITIGTYNDYGEDLIQDEITTTALDQFKTEQEDDNLDELRAATRANAKP